MRHLAIVSLCAAVLALGACGKSAENSMSVPTPPTAEQPSDGEPRAGGAGNVPQEEPAPEPVDEAKPGASEPTGDGEKTDDAGAFKPRAYYRTEPPPSAGSESTGEASGQGPMYPGAGEPEPDYEPGMGGGGSPPVGEASTPSPPPPPLAGGQGAPPPLEEAPLAGGAPPTEAPTLPMPPGSTVPSAGSSSTTTTEGPSGGSGPPDAGPAGGAAPPSEEAQGDWDVVPVFYGTDRNRAADKKRLDYGSGRARRLELGRALVTVPRSHRVPQIERPWAIRIPYLNVTIYEEEEDPNVHFTMKEVRDLPQDQFLSLVRERLAASTRYKDHAFIFVHGYNTTFDYAIYRTAQIAYDLKFDGAAFSYSWPSGGGLASYTYDRESSGQSEPYLRQFMDLVIKQTGAKAVSIIAHSMGNIPTLEVLKDLKASQPPGVILSQIILAAPDVDRDNFENIAAEIQGLANGVTLYAAANDRALMVSKNFYGGIPRAGDVPETGPLVLPGIDTIDVTAASLDSLALNHSTYAENNALLNDIGALIETGLRPPGMRMRTLVPVVTDKGTYWRYPAGP